jgi:REP element-mobilizing transposase RayT
MERKQLRLKGWDYSKNGAYFITICTKDKKHLFGHVGADSISAQMIDKTFNEIIGKYNNVYCSKYVIMPNHFHAIIHIERADMESAPTISKVIQEFKRYSTIEYIKLVKQDILPPFDKQLWQRSYFDHVIRNQQDYEDAWNYIEGNPSKWKEDELY